MSPHDEGYSRPTSIADLQSRRAVFVSPEGLQQARDFKPDPTDVFVATPPKCGTTWMQQIVHGLRTRGSMDFDNINDVVPWLQMAIDMGQDIHAPQVARPRAFKTHSAIDEVPKGGRYIVVVRDPKDALLSGYRFFEGVFFEEASIDLNTFAQELYLPDQAVPHHVLAAWARRDDPDVLMLCFENLKADLAGEIERVARFIGVRLDTELLDIVVRQSDIGFMKAHESKFDDAGPFETIRHRMQLPPTTSLSKVVNGHVGAATSAVSEQVQQQLSDLWSREVTPATGLDSYADLVHQLAGQPLRDPR